MAVGQRERSDITLQRNAKWIQIGGRRFMDQTVYSDENDPTRRDIFAPNQAQTMFNQDLPDMASVRYLGETYDASLSFRTGTAGQAIPVYQFRVESRAPT